MDLDKYANVATGNSAKVFKKCTECKRVFTKEELEDMLSKLKVSKEKVRKNTCPDCRRPLKTWDESRFQKKWYGYLSGDKNVVDHLILVEFNYYDDGSFEVKVPLLDFFIDTKDFSQAFDHPEKEISAYLRDKYNVQYDSEHKFFTQAFIGETTVIRQNVPSWF